MYHAPLLLYLVYEKHWPVWCGGATGVTGATGAFAAPTACLTALPPSLPSTSVAELRWCIRWRHCPGRQLQPSVLPVDGHRCEGCSLADNKADKGAAQVFNNCTGNVTLGPGARVALGLGPLPQFLMPRGGAVAVSGGTATVANSLRTPNWMSRALARPLTAQGVAVGHRPGAGHSGHGSCASVPRVESKSRDLELVFEAPLDVCQGAPVLASSLTCV